MARNTSHVEAFDSSKIEAYDNSAVDIRGPYVIFFDNRKEQKQSYSNNENKQYMLFFGGMPEELFNDKETLIKYIKESKKDISKFKVYETKELSINIKQNIEITLS